MALSVLMTTYAGDNPLHLHDAISSIWETQSIKPDQIVLVKDGPLSDELENVVAFWKEEVGSAFELVSLTENLGLAKALNVGLNYCTRELVARMDADDVALPNRFEKQLKFMESHRDIVASSSWIREYNEEMTISGGVRKVPEDSYAIEKFARRRSPLNHPAVVFRRKTILAVGGYPLFRKSQDFALWSLLLVNGYQLRNIPEVLLYMRTGEGFYRRRGVQHFLQEYEVVKYQRKIGFIGNFDFFLSVCMRFFSRILPSSCKKVMYRIIR